MDTYTVTIDMRGKVRVQVKARSLSEAAELAYEENEDKIIAAIEQASVDRPLDHVVTIIEQKAAKLHVGTLLGLGDHW